MPRATIAFLPIELRGSSAFPEPRRLRDARDAPLSRRAVQACPAVNGFERRTIEALAPYDLGLGLRFTKNEVALHVVPEWTRIDPELIGKFVTLMPRHTWRTTKTPVVQIAYPFYFATDVVCQLTQMSAWTSTEGVRLPGPLVGGRYPVHLWPRSLNLAFEWQYPDQLFRMKRGQPIFNLYAEIDEKYEAITLKRAEPNSKLTAYRSTIEDVVKYTSGIQSIYEEMKAKRPERLLEGDL